MWKDRAFLKMFGLFQVPMIAFANPELIRINDEEVYVRIKLNWRTRRRDIKSMYLGALAVGADIASGILAFRCGKQTGKEYSIIFKTLQCTFLKRPESHVYFHCTQGKEISQMLAKAEETGKREAMPVKVVATAPDTFGEEPVATFELVLTVKKLR